MFTNRHRLMTTILIMVLVALLAIIPLSAALADNPPGTGQPSQSCQAQTSTPGNAASAPGSAFNTSGTAGGVYAGTQP